MEVTPEKVGDVKIITLPGEVLDASSVPEFRRDIMPHLEEGSNVLFDMGELRFVDSSGLGVILSCLRKLNADGGDLKLFRMTQPVRALFELVRMHRIFDIFNIRDEALKAFGMQNGT